MRKSPLRPSRKPLRKVNPERLARRRAKYAAYLRSPEWKAQRKAALARAGHQCEQGAETAPYDLRCPETTRLHVHHMSYARLGHELPKDLLVLCKRHHEEVEALKYPHRRRSA